MDLPQTLHGQLYLLAYDRNRRRFDLQNLWLLGFALRAAMLTDLFLNGYLRDTDGLASPADGTRPGDPVLRAVFDTIGIDRPKTWSWLIAANQAHAPRLVRDQLKRCRLAMRAAEPHARRHSHHPPRPSRRRLGRGPGGASDLRASRCHPRAVRQTRGHWS
jgi:Golgi phosphoprotein 3 (GPP34)